MDKYFDFVMNDFINEFSALSLDDENDEAVFRRDSKRMFGGGFKKKKGILHNNSTIQITRK